MSGTCGAWSRLTASPDFCDSLSQKFRRARVRAEASDAPPTSGNPRFSAATTLCDSSSQKSPGATTCRFWARPPTPAQRLYYLRASAALGWSRNVLLNQIKAGAWERSRAEGKSHNFPRVLPPAMAGQAEEVLKSSYSLEFLGIRQAVKERELETRLLDRLRDFILELGYGFCFIGRQHRLVLGRKEYFIDLLFYHRFLKALVAVELKVGSFEPEYAGKMDFYLNLLNDRERAPGDAPSIGIILCAEKDNLEVEFALRSKTNPIGVAEYQLQAALPSELRGKLPSVRQLQQVVRGALPPPVATQERRGKD
jgi:predicted nuclease of restriction endonuclease-like (RecB) superfamily